MPSSDIIPTTFLSSERIRRRDRTGMAHIDEARTDDYLFGDGETGSTPYIINFHTYRRPLQEDEIVYFGMNITNRL